MVHFTTGYFFVLVLIFSTHYHLIQAGQVNEYKHTFIANKFNYKVDSQLPIIGERELSLIDLQDLSLNCLNELQMLMDGVRTGELWALKMLDAWGKIPAGLLYGNIMEFGNYDECLATRRELSNGDNLKGKYCLANIPLGGLVDNDNLSKVNLFIGTCLPSACKPNEFEPIIKMLLNELWNVTLNSSASLVPENLCYSDEPEKFKPLDWVTLGVFGILMVLVIIGTANEYYGIIFECPSNPFLKTFSLHTNIQQLFHISSHTNAPHVIPCLNGIRCLSIIWIIFGHSFFMSAVAPNINAIDGLEWDKTPFGVLMRGAFYAVDTFFFLSGLLLVIIALREMERNNGKLNVPMMFLHRFLRLTPVLALAIMFYMSLYQYMGQGPLWNLFSATNDICDDTWWATILYVQNYAAAGRMCLGHSWYLAVDMQLYILSPLILIPLWRWRKQTLGALSVVGLLLCACLFSIMIVNELSVIAVMLNRGQDIPEMRKIYYSTHTRTSPWIIGILFGYYLNYRKNRRLSLSKTVVMIGWLLSLGLIAMIIFVMYPKLQDGADPLPTVAGAFYLTLSRVGWPLALCWIVLACQNGYAGPINSFLSWSLWQPISKLSYCMYIWHLVIETIHTAMLKSNTYFSNYSVILRFWGDFGITILVSIFMYLLIEAPFLNLQKIIFLRKRPTKNNTRTSDVPVTTVSKQNLCD